MYDEKGQEIYELAERLYPICSSITVVGVRETLSILKSYTEEKNENEGGTKFKIHNVPTGI